MRLPIDIGSSGSLVPATPFVPPFDPAAQAAARQNALAAAQAAANAAEALAQSAQAAADAAVKQAQASAAAARAAAASAKKQGATEADKAAASQAQSKAASDQLDAAKKTSAADVLAKKAAWADARRDDCKAGRDPSTQPSEATLKAQADYNAAVQQDAIIDPPPGAADPLTSAQANSASALAALAAAPQSGREAAGSGWLSAVQYQMQVAALQAGAAGQDPKAAIQAQAAMAKSAAVDVGFDLSDIDKALQPTIDHYVPLSPAQIRAEMEYESESTAGQGQIAVLRKQIDDLTAKANALDAAANPPLSTVSPVGGLFPVLTPAQKVAAPAYFRTPAQLAATAAHAALNAANAQMHSLEAIYGHSDSNPDKNTIGTLDAAYDAGWATDAAAKAKASYQGLLATPGADPKKVQAAYHDWQSALDQQTLAISRQHAVDANAALVQANQDVDNATAMVAAQPAFASPLHPIDGNGIAAHLVPDHAPGGVQSPQQLLADAKAAAVSAKKNAGDTQQAFGQTLVDQADNDDPTSLNIAKTLDAAPGINGASSAAQNQFSLTERRLLNVSGGTPDPQALTKARLDFGHARQANDVTQAQVNLVRAMQELRDAQLNTSGGAQPANLDALMLNVRDAKQMLATLQSKAGLSPDQESSNRAFIKTQQTALGALGQKIQFWQDDTRRGQVPRDLFNQFDYLQNKITWEQAQITLSDAQAAAAAAPTEYSMSSPPTGVDLTQRAHSDDADYALTWSIIPDRDGMPTTSGLPSNISAADIQIVKDGDSWYAIFDKDAGAYAQRTLATGRSAVQIYVDGSKHGDTAIEKGYKYKLDPATAQLWDAVNTDPDHRESALVVANRNFQDAANRVAKDPVTDDFGNLVSQPNGLPSMSTRVDVDHNAAPTIDFNVDQAAAKIVAEADYMTASKALTDAQAKLNGNPQDPALQANEKKAEAARDLAKAKQDAIDSVLTWQKANLARQLADADAREAAASRAVVTPPLVKPQHDATESLFPSPVDAPLHLSDDPQASADPLASLAPPATSLQAQSDVDYKTAKASVDAWISKQQQVSVSSAQADVDTAQSAFDQWRSARAYLSDATAQESPQYAALQAAKASLNTAQLDNVKVATDTAYSKQQAFIAQNSTPAQQNTGRGLYALFKKDPQAMAQATINSAYANSSGGPTTYAGRDALTKMVTDEIGAGLPSSAIQAVVNQISNYGGSNATLTVIPVVYAVDADLDKGGGITQTVLFRVQAPGDPSAVKFVDTYGERYDKIDDYRRNNSLPVDGAELALPKDGNFTIGADGNVELFTGKAHTESGWQSFKRHAHVDMVMGAVGVVSGGVLEFASAGLLTEIAAPLMVASTSYFMASSAQSLENRWEHGQSIDPFSDREAGMDWLNIGASALELPGLAATTRIGAETASAVRLTNNAGADADKIAKVAIRGSDGRLLTRSKGEVTGDLGDYTIVAGASRATNAASRIGGLLGGVAALDSTADMVQHWRKMSGSDKEHEGVQFLMGIVQNATGKALTRTKNAGVESEGKAAADTAMPPAGIVEEPVDLAAPAEGCDRTTDDESDAANASAAGARPGSRRKGTPDALDDEAATDPAARGTPSTAVINGATHIQHADLDHPAPLAANSPPAAFDIAAGAGIGAGVTIVAPVESQFFDPPPVTELETDGSLLIDPYSTAASDPSHAQPTVRAKKQLMLKRLDPKAAAQLQRPRRPISTLVRMAAGSGAPGPDRVMRPNVYGRGPIHRPDLNASLLDDRGWTIDPGYSPAAQWGTLLRAESAGRGLEGADYVLYPLQPGQKLGTWRDPTADGLPGLLNAGEPGADPSVGPVAYSSLTELLGNYRHRVGNFNGHGIAIVARDGLDPGGAVDPTRVIATLPTKELWQPTGKVKLEISEVRLNPQRQGDLRIANPANWKQGDPLMSGDGAFDYVNAPAGSKILAANGFPPRLPNLDLYSDRTPLVDPVTGEPYLTQIPTPQGYYSIVTHGGSKGRWVIGPDGRTLNAREVAAIVRQDPNWQERPIFLAVCDSGTGHVQFAQELANELGVDVYGVTGSLGVNAFADSQYPNVRIASLELLPNPSDPTAPAPVVQRFRHGLHIAEIREGADHNIVFDDKTGLGLRPKLRVVGDDFGGTASLEPALSAAPDGAVPGPILTSDPEAHLADEHGWTVDPSLEPRILTDRVNAVLASGGRIDGDWVVYDSENDDEGNIIPPWDGFSNVKTPEQPGAHPSKGPVVYPTLKEALDAAQPASKFHIALTARGAVGPDGTLPGRQLIAKMWAKSETTDIGYLGSYPQPLSLNTSFEGTIRILWKEGWKPGDPVISRDGTVDLLNAAGPNTLPKGNAFRPQHVNMELSGDGGVVKNKETMAPIRAKWPIPEGYYSILVHGSKYGRWVQGMAGRALNAKEIAALVRLDPNWQGKPIFLVSCHSGFGPVQFAQELANELGVDVYGASGAVTYRTWRPDDDDAAGMIFRTLGLRANEVNEHTRLEPKFERYVHGLPIVGVTGKGGKTIYELSEDGRPEFVPSPHDGTLTTHVMSAGPGGSIPSGVPNLPTEFATTVWREYAEAVLSAPALQLAQAGPLETAVADILKANPAANTDVFVVSNIAPTDAIFGSTAKPAVGVNTPHSHNRRNINDAVALAKAKGGWVYRVSLDGRSYSQLTKAGHVGSDRIAGAIYVDKDGGLTSLVVANPSSDLFAGAGSGSSSSTSTGHAPQASGSASGVAASAAAASGSVVPPPSSAIPSSTAASSKTPVAAPAYPSDPNASSAANAPASSASGVAASAGAAPGSVVPPSSSAIPGSTATSPQTPVAAPPDPSDPNASSAANATTPAATISNTAPATSHRPVVRRVAQWTIGLGPLAASAFVGKFGFASLDGKSITLANFGSTARSSIKTASLSQDWVWAWRAYRIAKYLDAKEKFELELRDFNAEIDGIGGAADSDAFNAFKEDIEAIRKFKPGDDMDLRTKELTEHISDLRQQATALGLSPTKIDGHIDVLTAGVGARVKFDLKVQKTEEFIDALNAKIKAGSLTEKAKGAVHGVTAEGMSKLIASCNALKDALEKLHDADPDNDKTALANYRQALKGINVAEQLRHSDSAAKKALDVFQITTYSFTLGYLGRELGADFLHGKWRGDWDGLSVAVIGSAGNIADGISIVGKRLGSLGAKLGKAKLDEHPLITDKLPRVAAWLTAVGAVAGTIRVPWHDRAHLGSIWSYVDGGVYLVNAVAAGFLLANWRERHGAKPKTQNATRGVWTAGFALASSVTGLAVAADAFYNGSRTSASPSAATGKGVTTPPPAPSGSGTPLGPQEGTGNLPSWLHPTTALSAAPASPRPPAQVVVSGSDPRRDTLFDIAQANEATLLTPEELAAARTTGGDRGGALAALQQLFLLNPQRGFKPALMDGIASDQPGDPDTLQDGWVINVQNPAVH